MKTITKIAVMAMMGMSLGVNAQNTFPDRDLTTYAKILLGNQTSDGLSVFGSMGSGAPVNGTQDYGAYIGFNAYRDSDGNWKHLRTSTVGASRFTVGGDIATGLKGFNWSHTNNSGAGNIVWNNLMNLDTAGNLEVTGKAKFGSYVSGSNFRAHNSNNSESTTVQSYGVDFNRALSYLQPSGNMTSILYIGGYASGNNEWKEVNVRSGIFKVFNNGYFGGNVGIGTTTPNAKLHVNGDVRSDKDFVLTGIGRVIPDNANMKIWALESLILGTNGPSTNRIQINKNGTVGIGTISTGNHRLAVEGSIGAREIKVEATGWSDFVFYDDYQLPTLTEVEKHIKEKGHLKDIPSAKEVEKNGFFLGAMDAKLLQKIEELTLYTIEQDKNLKAQKEEIEELKKQNSKIQELEKLVKQLLKDKK